MATALEIKEKSGKMKKAAKSQGKVRKFKKKGKSGKSQGIVTGCLSLKVLPLLRFNVMICFFQNATSRIKGKFSEVMEKTGKRKVEKSGHPAEN